MATSPHIVTIPVHYEDIALQKGTGYKAEHRYNVVATAAAGQDTAVHEAIMDTCETIAHDCTRLHDRQVFDTLYWAIAYVIIIKKNRVRGTGPS